VTYRFHGRERVTLELDGRFDPAKLAFPPGLELELHDNLARVRLFAFDADGLRITGVPLVRASYAEVLWRIAVRDRGEPAWWVACCDLAAFAPRVAARRWVRYPTRDAKCVVVTGDRIEIAASLGTRPLATLELAFAAPTEATTPTGEPRRLLVGPNAEWEVPWGDEHAPASEVAVTGVEDRVSRATVGADVAWAPVAALRRGREHRCGTASPA
jgi:hypothetical protein